MIEKHFQALADALKRVKPISAFESLPQWRDDVEAVAGVCRQMNSAFDAERFYAACGYND